MGAVGAGAVLSARALLRPQLQTPRRLVDWDDVRRIAVSRSGELRGAAGINAEALEAAYTEMAARVAPLLVEVCQVPLTAYPRFVALDRKGFIDANLGMVQRLLAPVERIRASVPESLATGMSRRVLDRYVGELFGLMARRVLRQVQPGPGIGRGAETTARRARSTSSSPTSPGSSAICISAAPTCAPG